jgi:hypothetical protein
MGKYGVQNPISAGQYLASYDSTAINNTDWNTLTSNDFYDVSSGIQLEAGLKIAFLSVYSNNSSSLSYIKLRAAGGAGDPIGNTAGVIPVAKSFQVDVQALADSSTTSISYKKASSSDQFIIICGFNTL